ncbi:ribosome assembly factor SBDS [Candidatus Bathyarchaeota archaeon]|nr:ribosome assembly factor SBDS [Candidatus Bathyarchaeota archaeon]
MDDKYTLARITVGGEHFEILVKPNLALQFKQGQEIDISKILVAEEIFADSGKGLRASEVKLKKAFGTDDVYKVANTILHRGELQLTTDQRRELVEIKRKQIINFISHNCIDPRTGAPHPPLRIEQALSQIRLIIDPFKSGEEQAKDVIDDLRPILPLRMEKLRVAVKIPPEHAPKAIGAVKEYGTVSNEEWQSDGSWIAVVEMPAGVHTTFLERVGKITQGNYQTRILK